MFPLPPPSTSQAYCIVSALEAGHIELMDELFMTPSAPGALTVAPSLSFLVRHSEIKDTLVFDLGIRRDWYNQPPRTVAWIKSPGHAVHVPVDVADSLAKGGLSPVDITRVVLSHCHHDHVGDPRPFTDSEFLVGAQSKVLFDPGYPADPESRYSSDLLPADRTTYLEPEEWPPLGPFPHALDLYGDGSLYIVNAPGHAPGHINLLARTSPDGGWIYLAGDSAHNWRLINGEAEVSVGHPGWLSGQGHGCAHYNKEQADEHVARLRTLGNIPRVRIIIAHDEPWFAKHKGGDMFFPGTIPTL
ncbi:hypothetical protein HGRIS_005756 [Hohenbuehelia grisea]|uniref:Metallo-beta-lactamase domain-containing protein n=1 Tax=Hohenbuehelia grisea TaxID=104357 RepID=A0ABR3K034_9AGAR